MSSWHRGRHRRPLVNEDESDLRAKINRLRQKKQEESDRDLRSNQLEEENDDTSLSLSSVEESHEVVSLSSEEDKPKKSKHSRRSITPASNNSSKKRGRKRPRKAHHRKRSRSPPPRHNTYRRDHRRKRYRSPNYNQKPPQDQQSWEDKVSEFMKKINDDTTKKEEKPEEPSCDSITLTPLMKFVAGKLISRKISLTLTGVFQYSILSLLSRGEWVSAKAIQLLDEAGFDNDWLYDNVAIKGGSGLRKELKEALHNGKINIGKDKPLLDQFIRIIDFIVKYYTSEEMSESEEEEEEEQQPSTSKQGSIGSVLERIVASNAPPPPPPKEPETINHWSVLADNMQSSNLKSFEMVESYLSQDLLRITAQSKEDAQELLMINNLPTKDAFEVARHMVMCWVNAGYSFDQLWAIVSATNAEDILPPRDPNDTSGYFIGAKKKGDKDFLAHKFIYQFKTMNKSMNSRQIDYVVWRSLLYVMRGCDKKFSNQVAGSSSKGNYKVSYNYLPPGLREMEQTSKYGKEEAVDIQPSDLPMLSNDPMNIIIDPHGLRTEAKGEGIPRRKYFVAAVNVEYVMAKGKPEVYEISLHCQDMTNLELFIVPDALKKETTILEALGFTLNKNLNRYFYVQSGTGCVQGMTMMKAMEKLTEFLDKKRLAGDENQNNGLVLLLKNQDSMSAFLNVLTQFSPDLTLNTIKGFGVLSSICHLEEMQINMVGSGVCLSATIICGTRSEEVLAKSKPEVLFKALEAGLQVCNPGYDSFVQPHCFPSDGTKIKNLKMRSKNLEAMYELEIFLASELKANNVKVYLEGIYAIEQKDLRHNCDIVASKFCQALVDVGLNLESLSQKFASIAGFTIVPDLVLDLMDKPQRLKVIDQTRACIDFVRNYFRSCASN